MTTATHTINMFQATVDTHQLQHWMAQTATRDQDQAIHKLLVESFGTNAPRPHRLMEKARKTQATQLYGYTSASQEELRNRAQACADPLQAAILPPETIMTKPMPEDWQSGETFGFNLRVRPMIRSWHTRESQDPDFPDQVHVMKWKYATDAYFRDSQKRAEKGLPPRDRTEVYREWLDELLKRQGGAQLMKGSNLMVDSFRKSPKDVKRNSSGALGPEAVVRGTLVVIDPGAFRELLRNGAGRYKAYGYGMVLLRARPS